MVIIGAGLVGSETAVHFLREGKEVTLLEMTGDFAPDANPFQKMSLGGEFSKGVNLKLNTKAKTVTKDGVIAVGSDGKETLYPADTIFCSVGMKSHAAEAETLRNTVLEFRSIGDCVKPGKAIEAVHGGYYAALDL